MYICLIFISQIVLYILHSTLVLSFYTDVVLTLSIGIVFQITSYNDLKYQTQLYWMFSEGADFNRIEYIRETIEKMRNH